MNKFSIWVEAMRLRTLPVSVAGVLTACGYAILFDCFRLSIAILALSFAILAQIASNFANEYYDFKNGLDSKGRIGPRRGVTEGDITPTAMLSATFVTLTIAGFIGLILAWIGGWWLIAAGVAIGLAVLAYSTGPYPLSHHGLGEIAVICFFGLIPVNLTYYIMSGGDWSWHVASGGLATGLMGANVLIVNNYRDADDDKAVGKHTLAVIWGRKTMANIYLINGIAALIFFAPTVFPVGGFGIEALYTFYILSHYGLWKYLKNHTGSILNPILGKTAVLMLIFSVAFCAIAALN